MNIWGLLNILAGVIIFVHCACKLTLRRWHWRESGLWINMLLIGGAIFSIGFGLINQAFPEWPEILINWGLALLFTMRAWRLWREGLLFKKKGDQDAGKP